MRRRLGWYYFSCVWDICPQSSLTSYLIWPPNWFNTSFSYESFVRENAIRVHIYKLSILLFLYHLSLIDLFCGIIQKLFSWVLIFRGLLKSCIFVDIWFLGFANICIQSLLKIRWSLNIWIHDSPVPTKPTKIGIRQILMNPQYVCKTRQYGHTTSEDLRNHTFCLCLSIKILVYSVIKKTPRQFISYIVITNMCVCCRGIFTFHKKSLRLWSWGW